MSNLSVASHSHTSTAFCPAQRRTHLCVCLVDVIDGGRLMHGPKVAQALDALVRHAIRLQVRQQPQPACVVLSTSCNQGQRLERHLTKPKMMVCPPLLDSSAL